MPELACDALNGVVKGRMKMDPELLSYDEVLNKLNETTKNIIRKGISRTPGCSGMPQQKGKFPLFRVSVHTSMKIFLKKQYPETLFYGTIRSAKNRKGIPAVSEGAEDGSRQEE